MSSLIVPITIILLRGALSVLLLAGAEAIFEHKLKHLMSKVLKREQIAGQVFETSKNVLRESRAGTTNPQNGGNDFSDGPDDQTQ